MEAYMEKKKIFLLLLIICTGVVIRLIFFTGIDLGNDGLFYTFYAHSILNNTFKLEEFHWSWRFGVFLPVALCFHLFGINEFTAVLYPLVCSIATIFLIFLLGKLLFNENIGLLAGFLFSFFPLNVIWSTQLYPDVIANLLVGLIVYFFLKGEYGKDKKIQLINYFLSGIFIGIGYMTKVTTLLIIFSFLFYILHQKKIKISYLFIILGFLLIFIIQNLYLFSSIDPSTRVNALSASVEDIKTPPLKTLLPIFTVYFNQMLNILNPAIRNFGFFYHLIFIAVIYCLIKRVKNIYILIYWWLGIFLYLNFGSLTLSHYLPLSHLPRYLDIISIPAILILAYFLSYRKFYTKLLILIFLSSTSICFLSANALIRGKNDAYNSRQIYSFLSSHEEKIVYTDTRTKLILEFLFKYKKNYLFKSLSELCPEKTHEAYVIINWVSLTNALKQNPNTKLPLFVTNPPKTWVKIKTISNPINKNYFYRLITKYLLKEDVLNEAIIYKII
jgi:4-amino-4-deoxy-L-arabinose transferase-like glycosyltransferase